VLIDDGPHPLANIGLGPGPTHSRPRVAVATHRVLESVGRGVQFVLLDPFDAGEPCGADVVLVGPDSCHHPVVDGDLKSAQ
jgi:hypothetical protein